MVHEEALYQDLVYVGLPVNFLLVFGTGLTEVAIPLPFTCIEFYLQTQFTCSKLPSYSFQTAKTA